MGRQRHQGAEPRRQAALGRHHRGAPFGRFGHDARLDQLPVEGFAWWKEQVGEGKAVKWPTGQGGKGNEGVAAYVGQLKNSIGYVEYAYAKQNKLAWTQLQNKAGKFVQPEQKASPPRPNADWKSAPGMGVVLTDEPGADSWPVTAATFILVHKSQDKPVQGKAVLDFFDWAFKNGAKSAEAMDYVPLPEAVTRKSAPPGAK